LAGPALEDATDTPAATRSSAEILFLRQTVLPVSKLPSPSYFIPDSDVDEDADSDMDMDSDLSDADTNDAFDRDPPATAPQLLTISTHDSEEETSFLDEEDDSDAESEGSLDLLASARQADPAMVREREREYDANMAERLAEEIPAGSSAATAGGGSGFNSPVNVAGEEDEENGKVKGGGRMASGIVRVPASLKRARSSNWSTEPAGKAPKLE